MELPDEQVQKYHAKMEDESFRLFLDLSVWPCTSETHQDTNAGAGCRKGLGPGPDAKAITRAYGVRVEMIPYVGHYMILEPGWRLAAKRILNWLKERGI
jgi:hypothetical protein